MKQQSSLDVNTRSIIFVNNNSAALSPLVECSDIASLYRKCELVMCRVESIEGRNLSGVVLVAANPFNFPIDAVVSFEMRNIFGITKP